MKARFPEGWGGRWAGQMEWTGDMPGHSVWGGGAASGAQAGGQGDGAETRCDFRQFARSAGRGGPAWLILFFV